MAAPKWSSEELSILHQYYGKHGSYVVWKALRIKGFNRTQRAVLCTANRYGIKCEQPPQNKGGYKLKPEQVAKRLETIKRNLICMHEGLPLGTVRTVASGTFIKIGMPNKWQSYGRYLWLHHFGEIPPDYRIAFKDGNNKNFELSNLACVSRAEHAKMVREFYKHRQKELDAKARETRLSNRRAALRQKYGSISAALAAGETL